MAKAENVLPKRKQLNKRKNMKLMQYQRPGLAWPNLGRLAGLQDELDRLFESPMTGWAPALDVHEDADNFTIRVEVPGLKREDIGVSLQDGALVISGERKAEKVEDGVEVHRQERFYGKFQRALTLPAPVAADKVKAAYKDGVLTVTLPKAEEAKPKQIDVSVN
jgi:HSP20 family protein